MKQDKIFRKSEARNHPLRGDGKVAIGVLIGILIAVVLYLTNHIWSELLTTDQFIAIAPALAAFLVALVSLLVSFRGLTEQKRMRQAGVDPVLIAHLSQDPQFPLILTLNISNVGAGAAVNVYAKILGEIKDKHGEFVTKILKSDFYNSRSAITVILQDQTVSHWMGRGPDLYRENRMEPFYLELSYQDIEGANYQSTHPINLDALELTNANEPNSTKIWRELEKIRKNLER